MAYEETILATPEEYRALYIQEYCNPQNPIYTFDNIRVKFFDDKFEHAFYESSSWQKGDKSIFSIDRAKRITWIKEALMDSAADLRIGWDKGSKSYDNSIRVAIVVGMYVVIIRLKSPTEAKFISAFWADKSITQILASPLWTG